MLKRRKRQRGPKCDPHRKHYISGERHCTPINPRRQFPLLIIKED